MRAKLKRVGEALPKEIKAGLYQVTEGLATLVKERTPVDTGNLRASVHVVGPFSEGAKYWTLIVCGGPSAPYAVYVHENLHAHHEHGQAKFLESVLLENRAQIASMVAQRIDFNRMVR